MSVISSNTSLLDERVFVRALYPFESKEDSSLSFEEGDIIRVLTKLESGWWDGLLYGRRGWFPSNFVEPIELVESREGERSTSRQRFPVTLQHETSSSSQGDCGTNGSMSPYWIPQATDDGIIYYYNTRTGAVQHDIPIDLAPVTSNSTVRQVSGGLHPPTLGRGHSGDAETSSSALSSDNRSTLGFMASNQNWKNVSDGEDNVENSQDIPMIADGDGKILLFSVPERRNTLEPPMTPSIDLTDDISEHQFDPPQRKKSLASEPSVFVRGQSDALPVLLDWSTRLATALGALRQAMLSRRKDQYENLCDAIRLIICDIFHGLGMANMLSETSDLASTPNTTNSATLTLWRNQFRRILASLSKLMLSSHAASNPWAVPEALEKLSSDVAELTAIVDAFLLHIRQTTDVELKITRKTPVMLSLLTTGGSWRDNGLVQDDGNTLEQEHRRSQMIPLSAELPQLLEEPVEQVVARLRTCRSKAGTLSTKSSVVDCEKVQIAWLETLTALRPVQQLCERVDLSPLSPDPAKSDLPRSPTIADFLATKQQIYDLTKQRMMDLQELTRSNVMANEALFRDAVTALTISFGSFDGTLRSTMMHMEFMVQEYLTKYSLEPPRTPTSGVMLESPFRAPKLRQLLGEDVPESPTDSRRPSLTTKTPFAARSEGTDALAGSPSSPVKTPTPWFLDHDLEHELVYDHKGNIKGGTLLALVERLTRHDFLDSTYNSTFLLTYKSFTTAEELSRILMQRFVIPPPEGLTSEQLQLWVEKKQQPIKLRVFNIFKSWMESFFMEPQTQETVDWLNRLNEFAVTQMAPVLPGVPVLTKLIDMRIEQGDVPFRKMTLNLTTPMPPPIIPKNSKRLRLLEIDPLEMARQLTIMESTLYNRIKPVECLNKLWSQPDANTENIKAMIFNSNRLTMWTAEVILAQEEIKRRVQIIKHLIQVVRRLRELNNFSTLTAIVSGLNSAPIHRLRRTWTQVPNRHLQVLESQNDLINSAKNFSTYREALHSQSPPCVPFLGVYLTDLTFIDEGNPHLIHHKGRALISFAKRQKTAEVIREIQQYQHVPYALQPLPDVQNFIMQCLDLTRGMAEMWELSLLREPREREDEKIARLLQESGFL
jgi:son of sevenless-like protein